MASADQLREYRFYRERFGDDGQLRPWGLADLEDFAASHPNDPFAGRLRDGFAAKFALQLEATEDPPIWIALEPPELDRWAGVIERMWTRWGTARGETVAFFDYGSSPFVLLASGGYVGYLRRGAADRLGLTAICNDGVAAMAGRMVAIVETLRPSMLIVRRDLAVPLAMALEAAGVNLLNRVRWVAISEVEGAISRAEAAQLSTRFSVPVWRILRSDAAFLLVGECPGCRAFHIDKEYRAEALASGHVATTTHFAKACPAVRFDIGTATLLQGGCAAEPRAQRLQC
jgi:phenylacetate-coenzyme A ligase PaaK-like adenylate-forming protein